MNKLLTLAVTALVAATALAQPATTEGEVTKVDKPAARVTLKHGGVKNLDMPPMTIAFRVADPKMLDGLVVGDKVRFAADKVGGHYTVTALVKAH
jgi:Cu(I)/Ag(I) efflux system protein CusF